MSSVIFDDQFFEELNKKLASVGGFFKSNWLLWTLIVVVVFILVVFQQVILGFFLHSL